MKEHLALGKSLIHRIAHLQVFDLSSLSPPLLLLFGVGPQGPECAII